MKPSNQLSLNLARGLVATIACGLGGAFASVALALAFTVCRWLVSGATDFDREYDLRGLEKDMVTPVIGVAVVFACAEWATCAPVETFRFARSLWITFLASVSLWCALSLWRALSPMELTPRRYKGIEHPVFYPSELLILIAPPTVAAALLTAIRIRGRWKSTLP